MASRELRALITLAGRVDPSLQHAMMRTAGETQRIARNTQETAHNMVTVGDIIKGSFVGNVAANAFTSLTGRITEFASESVQLASDLAEVQNIVSVTFKDSEAQINSWSQTALQAYGLSELQAKQYTGTMGAMLKSLGIAQNDMVIMSQNLAGLAGDKNLFPMLEAA